MNRIDLLLFKGHYVQIAVPHMHDSERYFWEHGIVQTIDDNYLILKNGDHLKKIMLENIIEIFLDNRSQ
jgi:hypothetical protein